MEEQSNQIWTSKVYIVTFVHVLKVQSVDYGTHSRTDLVEHNMTCISVLELVNSYLQTKIILCCLLNDRKVTFKICKKKNSIYT